MLDTIQSRGRSWSLCPGQFWHLAKPDSLLLHNVFLGEGLDATISRIRRIENNDGFVTPYALAYEKSPKEQTWEHVRKAINPALPSRMGALFMFDNEPAADAMNAAWFHAEGRLKLRVRLVDGVSTFSRLDARWLDGPDAAWADRAAHYWAGEMTDQPLPEVVLDGFAFFPDWESAPFGSIFARRP